MSQRRKHTAKFKKQVALEAVKERLTVSQLAAKHGVHPTQVKSWKRVLTEESVPLFERKNKRNPEGPASLYENTQLDVLPNRKKETLVAHFQKLGKDFCNRIELVYCDI